MDYSELGIDEAGRGPVLGPMVMAGVLVPDGDRSLLKEWGVQDSKAYGSRLKSRQRREIMARRIMAAFAHQVVVIDPQTIDRHVRQHALNRLEQETALRIMSALPADRVVLDGNNLFQCLEQPGIKALNKADQTHLSVAAASILAKWKRDSLFAALCLPFLESFGEIRGGGYANGKTLEFVKWHLERNGHLPDFYRKSYRWKALAEG